MYYRDLHIKVYVDCRYHEIDKKSPHPITIYITFCQFQGTVPELVLLVTFARLN